MNYVRISAPSLRGVCKFSDRFTHNSRKMIDRQARTLHNITKTCTFLHSFCLIHANMHTYSRYRHTRTRFLYETQLHWHTHILIQMHRQLHTHMYTYTHTHTHMAYAHAHPQTHPFAHTHKLSVLHTYTHTHTHRHCCCRLQFPPPVYDLRFWFMTHMARGSHSSSVNTPSITPCVRLAVRLSNAMQPVAMAH